MYKRIKDLREDGDLKQSDIAKIINTTQQQYSKIENGKSEPTAEKLIKLSQYYKVSVDYILGLSDKK
ncbi:MAG: helix-turn-helix transcriptional regulator [Eubacterium sp.]|nr:helix-turn-helix transcriptional regulator [Eubacterium sp.]